MGDEGTPSESRSSNAAKNLGVAPKKNVARLRRELSLFKKLTRDVGRIVAIASWNVPTGPPVLVGRIRQGSASKETHLWTPE